MSLKKLAIMLMANLMFAFGSAYFLVPSGMISGGVTGLALGLDRGFGIPKDITVWVLQVALFLLGLWLVGKTFAATTLIGSFAYPLLFSSFFGVRVGRAVTLFFFSGLTLLSLSAVISYIKALSVNGRKERKTAAAVTLFTAAVGLLLITNELRGLRLTDQSILPLIGLFAGTVEAFFLSFKVKRFKLLLRFFIPALLIFLVLRKIFI